jgi:hypothetical protein
MNARRRAAYTADIKQARAYARSKKKARYSRNPQKFRDLARLDRKKPGAKERQATLSKLWAERNRDRVKASATRGRCAPSRHSSRHKDKRTR